MTRTPVELGRRDDLQADCSNCFGLCCVALAFARSADFAVDKDAGDPCDHLDSGYRCDIHSQLRERGFKGCTVFDCFGAGQRVSQQAFSGVSWRENAATRSAMFESFALVRRLHELLWYLDEAQQRADGSLRSKLLTAAATIDAITLLPASQIGDVDSHFDAVRPLLLQVSEAARSRYPAARRLTHDQLGASLRGADLRGADLRGRVLIAADLREADLRGADLIGADLRDARLEGADLSETMFVTPTQLASAHGDVRTRVPAGLRAPAHWVG